MANQPPTPQNSGLMLVISYVVLFVVNSLVLMLANRLFPDQVVLGTAALTPLWATCLSMGKLALINTFGIPFVTEYELRKKTIFTPIQWMVTYFLLNAVGLWLISRFSEQFGLGVRSWLVVVLLAAVMDLVQGIVMMQLEKIRPKFS